MESKNVQRKRRKPALKTRRWVAISSTSLFIAIGGALALHSPATPASPSASNAVSNVNTNKSISYNDEENESSDAEYSNAQQAQTAPTTTWAPSRTYNYSPPVVQSRSNGS